MSGVRNPSALSKARAGLCRRAELKNCNQRLDRARPALDAKARHVFSVLWTFARNDDAPAVAWPKLSTVAEHTALGESSIKAALKALHDAGEVWSAKPPKRGRLTINGHELDRGVRAFALPKLSEPTSLCWWIAEQTAAGATVEGAGTHEIPRIDFAKARSNVEQAREAAIAAGVTQGRVMHRRAPVEHAVGLHLLSQASNLEAAIARHAIKMPEAEVWEYRCAVMLLRRLAASGEVARAACERARVPWTDPVDPNAPVQHTRISGAPGGQPGAPLGSPQGRFQVPRTGTQPR